MPEKKDEARVKRDEVDGYTEFGRCESGLNWSDSLESILQSIEARKKDVQWEHITGFIKPRDGLRVIDCGAGRCWSSYLLAHAGCEVVAVDFNTDNAVGLGAGRKLIRETGISFHIVCADLERLPFKDQVFDCALGSQFLHHAYSMTNMLSEISHVLSYGGTLVAINEHTLPIYMRDDSEFREMHPAVACGANEHAYHYSHYLQCFKKAQFRCVSSFPYPFWKEYLKRKRFPAGESPRSGKGARGWIKYFAFKTLSVMYSSVVLRPLAKLAVHTFALTSFSFIVKKADNRNGR